MIKPPQDSSGKAKPRKRKKISPLIDDYHLLSYEELDSTNEEAKRIAEGGGAHGAFIWSLRQTHGKGRLQREWISSDGNLFVSVLLQPDCALKRLSQLAFITAVAAADSLNPLLPLTQKIQVKWPNDLMIDGAKVGGILLESFESREEDIIKRWIVVGLGVNIDSAPRLSSMLYQATSLKDAGVEIVSAKIVLSRFIHHFIETYSVWQEKGFTPIRKRWQHYAPPIGARIQVNLPDRQIEGNFHGIDATGNLLLVDASGHQHEISAGDVREF